MRFTISARDKCDGVPILGFLAKNFANVAIAQIDSVFGFVGPTPLYGGRVFVRPELTPHDVAVLRYVGIGLRLPLTNHFVEPFEYNATRALLEEHHQEGNAAIVTNDELARWIRRDFPKYRIEASVIKNLRTPARITEALETYDTIVLPMELNRDDAFLANVPCKERITLFANAGCAFTCPSKICYVSISKINKTGVGEFKCSQPLKSRQLLGMVDFDLDHLQELGFSRFKLLRARPGGLTGH